jgi:hypothetical protein
MSYGNEISKSGNSRNVNVAINETEILVVIVAIILAILEDD